MYSRNNVSSGGMIYLQYGANHSEIVADSFDKLTRLNLLFSLYLFVSLIFQMKEALSEIIQLATVDSEPWVLMVADILKSFPETGSLNLDLEEQNPNVQDILGELREKGWSDINDCSASKGSKVIVNNFYK